MSFSHFPPKSNADLTLQLAESEEIPIDLETPSLTRVDFPELQEFKVLPGIVSIQIFPDSQDMAVIFKNKAAIFTGEALSTPCEFGYSIQLNTQHNILARRNNRLTICDRSGNFQTFDLRGNKAICQWTTISTATSPALSEFSDGKLMSVTPATNNTNTLQLWNDDQFSADTATSISSVTLTTTAKYKTAKMRYFLFPTAVKVKSDTKIELTNADTSIFVFDLQSRQSIQISEEKNSFPEDELSESYQTLFSLELPSTHSLRFLSQLYKNKLEIRDAKENFLNEFGLPDRPTSVCLLGFDKLCVSFTNIPSIIYQLPDSEVQFTLQSLAQLRLRLDAIFINDLLKIIEQFLSPRAYSFEQINGLSEAIHNTLFPRLRVPHHPCGIELALPQPEKTTSLTH